MHICEPSQIIWEPPENAAQLPHSQEWDGPTRILKYKKKKKNIFFLIFFLNDFPDHHFCAYVW